MLSRPRRNRQSPAIRAQIRETELTPGHLVQPIFLMPDPNARLPIVSLPGTFRLGIEEVVREVGECRKLGIYSFIMFPAVPEEHKDKTGTYAKNEDAATARNTAPMADAEHEITIAIDTEIETEPKDVADAAAVIVAYAIDDAA